MKTDKIGINGILDIKIYNESNKLVHVIREKNKVVDNAFEIIYDLFNGDGTKGISKLAVGTGGILNSVVKTVDDNDHDLYTKVKETSEVAIVKNTLEKSISYNSTIRFGTGESYLLSEAGLFNNDDVMFSRKCFTEFVVDANFSIVINWKIFFILNN